jgi:hypothetical protein
MEAPKQKISLTLKKKQPAKIKLTIKSDFVQPPTNEGDVCKKVRKKRKEKEKKQDMLYRVIKCPLKTVLKNYDLLQPILEQNVKDMNQIIILGYQFITLYILDHWSRDLTLPIVTEQWILQVLKTICSKNIKSGRKLLDSNEGVIEDLKHFYDTRFSLVTKISKPSQDNKSAMLKSHAKQMFTSIETNISVNYIKHLSKYVNCLFGSQRKKEIKEITDATKRKEEYKILNKDLRDLKTDLIENTIEHSKECYHQWLKDNRLLIHPEIIEKNLAYDVKINPLSYLEYVLYINTQLERMGVRPYQVIPQRTTMIPCHITFDTCTMIDIIDNKNKLFDYGKALMNADVSAYKGHIWERLLHLDRKDIFKQGEYTFHYQIKTDGWDCCLLFSKLKYPNGKRVKDKKTTSKNTDEEVNEFKELKSLTKEECESILANSSQYKFVGNDPGKRHISTITDETGTIYQYSACQRRRDTYTKRSAQIIENEKEQKQPELGDQTINQIEAVLNGGIVVNKSKKKGRNHRHRHGGRKKKQSSQSSETPKQEQTQKEKSVLQGKRSLNVGLYERFINIKNEVNEKVKEFYARPLFRKLSFRRFVRTKQADQQQMYNIQSTFLTEQEIRDGKELVIFHGDYSRTSQMKGCVPSPNIGFKRLMSKYFTVVDVDEYLTSQKYSKTHEQMENFIDNKKHSIHGILIPKENTERCIYVDRDVNASRNILGIAKHFLSFQERPEAFRRPLVSSKKTDS